MKRILYLIIITALLTSCEGIEIEKEVSSARLMEMVNELSSEPYEGRLSASDGHKRASDLMVNEFSKLGLQPFFENSYVQEVPVEKNEIDNVYFATIYGGELTPHLLGSDYCCRGFSGSGKVVGPMVFCGYGTQSSYSQLDVTNSIVLVFKSNRTDEKLNATELDILPREKARIAKQHGALAIMFLPLPTDPRHSEAQGSVYDGNPTHAYSFPMLQLSADFANKLFAENGLDFAKIKTEMDSLRIDKQFKLKESASIEVSARYKSAVMSQNVAALLKGTDSKLKEEIIVVGAHIDHVGKQAGLIFPGANDNASGVAAIREIATIMAKHKVVVKRTIVFVLFTGEELGLVGSTQFVNSLTKNQKVVAMLNFDCIAEGDSISVRGKATSPVLYNIMKHEDKQLNSLVANENILGGGADAEPFYRAGIPTLYFTTTNGYHHLHVAGDSPESLNKDLFTEIVKLGLKTTMRLASGQYVGEGSATKQ